MTTISFCPPDAERDGLRHLARPAASSEAPGPRRAAGRRLARPAAHQSGRPVQRLHRRRPEEGGVPDRRHVAELDPASLLPQGVRHLPRHAQGGRRGQSGGAHASRRQGLRRLDRAPAGAAGPGRLPVLFARRPGRRQRGDSLLQPRQVRRPVSTRRWTISRRTCSSASPASRPERPPRPPPPQAAPIVVPNGRTVFLSKPASDMKAAYARLVNELQGKGFTVAPDPNQDPPDDASAARLLRRRRSTRPRPSCISSATSRASRPRASIRS